MRFGSVQIFALAIFLVCGLATAEAGVSVVAFDGAGISETPGETGATPVAVGAELAQGDTVTIGTGATMTIRFDDGSVIDFVGPAQFTLSLDSEFARTIDLITGTIERAVIGDIPTGIRTPGGPFLALENSTGRATVTMLEDDQVQAVFELLAGDNGKVGREGGVAYSIDVGQPETFVSSLTPIPGPAGGDASSPEEGEYQIGPHTIVVEPSDQFDIQPTPDGGMKIISNVPEGEFGVVTIDGQTKIFLANGESVEFDGSGVVTENTGIVHVISDMSIIRRANFDDPIGDPADSSFTGFKRN